MFSNEFETFLNRLVKLPLKNQITVDFDQRMKIFRLSVAIYQAPTKLPCALKNYVQSRGGKTFRPHKTYFRIDDSTVHLEQELPFQWGHQPTLRGQTVEFWRLAQKCHQMLSEIAAE